MNMIQSRPEEKSKKLCKFNPKNWQSKSCSSTHLQSPVSLLRGVSSVVWHTVSSHLLNVLRMESQSSWLINLFLCLQLQSPATNELNILSSDSNTTVRNHFVSHGSPTWNTTFISGSGACWIKEALDKSESSSRLCLNISSAKFDQACSAVGT